MRFPVENSNISEIEVSDESICTIHYKNGKSEVFELMDDVTNRHKLSEALVKNGLAESIIFSIKDYLLFLTSIGTITVSYKTTDLPGSKVCHGTLESQVESVKSGPKNIGTGFGGAGLYVALENERHIASECADIAKQTKPLEKAVVMEGN